MWCLMGTTFPKNFSSLPRTTRKLWPAPEKGSTTLFSPKAGGCRARDSQGARPPSREGACTGRQSKNLGMWCVGLLVSDMQSTGGMLDVHVPGVNVLQTRNEHWYDCCVFRAKWGSKLKPVFTHLYTRLKLAVLTRHRGGTKVLYLMNHV